MAFDRKVVVFFVLQAFLKFTQSNELLVQTTSGPVEGLKRATTNVFIGIPYAQPPLGDLRFKPPLPFNPSKTVIKAHEKPKSCMQGLVINISKEMDEFFKQMVGESSEDCLYLNVYTPSPKPENAAVMVWIHGGAYEGGSANFDISNGEVLASQGVIVVAMNYRLSLFGFMLLDSDEIPGNVGFMDQALALQWVQKNIENFGGDPNRVTIFGESAGAMSVSHHLFIPSSQGLFRRAIMQSGTAQGPGSFADRPTALKTTEKLLKAAGCDVATHTEKIKCLRNKNAADLITAVKSIPRQNIILFSPSVDGKYIVGDPRVLQTQLKFSKDVDIMLGSTSEDGYMISFANKILEMSEDFFADEGKFLDYLRAVLKTNHAMLAHFTKFLYTDWKTIPTNWRRPIGDFDTDFIFTCPTVNTADHATANGNNVYFYQFEHRPSMNIYPTWSGVGHGDELPFMFGLPLVLTKMFTPEEVQLSQKMMKYWTQFAKTGNPNSDGENIWPRYTAAEKGALIIKHQDEVINGVRLQRCAFHNTFLPQLERLLDDKEVQHCDISDSTSKCTEK